MMLPMEARICRVLYQPCPFCNRDLLPGDTIFALACTSPVKGPACYDCGIRLLMELDPEQAKRHRFLSPLMAARLPDRAQQPTPHTVPHRAVTHAPTSACLEPKRRAGRPGGGRSAPPDPTPPSRTDPARPPPPSG